MTPDRSDWGPGPWDDEPDRIELEASGLPCVLVRGPVGAWCGYVGVRRPHRLFRKKYGNVLGPDEVPADLFAMEGRMGEDHGILSIFGAGRVRPEEPRRIDLILRVHGGVTWSDFNGVVRPGPWWIGFDCSHSGDLAPDLEATMRRVLKGPRRPSHGAYRDLAYVRAQVERLAGQVAAIDTLRRERAARCARSRRLAWARSFNGSRGGIR